MDNFLSGQDITATVDYSDVLMTVTALSYRVTDETGLEIVALTSIALPAAAVTHAQILVPAASNTVPTGTVYYPGTTQIIQPTIAARTVTLHITGTGLASGTVLRRTTYAILLEDRLPIPSASFQTLTSADLVANDLIDVAAFTSATDSTRTAALMEARNRLVRLRYFWLPEDWMRRVSMHIELSEYWFNTMALSEWLTMDIQFVTAITRAQVLEANAILLTDSDSANRNAGVVSVKIGESSRTYITGRTAASAMPLCPRAMKILGRFLAPTRITRT